MYKKGFKMAFLTEEILRLRERSYVKKYGKVVKIVGLTIESLGPEAKLGDVCTISSTDKSSRTGCRCR